MERTKVVIGAINELVEDNTIPKNIREKLQRITVDLGSESELSLKIDRALHELESISEDSNLQAYTRTQVWNIVSMLESLN